MSLAVPAVAGMAASLRTLGFCDLANLALVMQGFQHHQECSQCSPEVERKLW